MNLLALSAACLFITTLFAVSSKAQTSDASLTIENVATPISTDLIGIFFEDINYAADGGLYGELVQNRSFDYSPAIRKEWTPLTAWELAPRAGQGELKSSTTSPLNANNPIYAELTIQTPGVALVNSGFDGIALEQGDAYDVSLFTRRVSGDAQALVVRLESKDGAMLAEAKLSGVGNEWAKQTATLTPSATTKEARLVIVPQNAGTVALDMISLFPQKTFKGRPNGMRADLAQLIADLKPRFVRFPGGCLAHGYGLDNMYRWKDTIGPIEQRKGQRNIWGYYQSVGLGYFEYFQFCEDIGAMPLPVVPAGVCCQNAGAWENGKWGQGQQGIPMDQMPAYIQDVLDLIEWANGPADSKWGAKRAAAGHPEPFGLKYLGVGNEDHITDTFETRFKMIYDAVREKHPEIVVIGTVGPSWQGEDYEKGWDIARKMKLPMVDEHYYVAPDWFWEHLDYYGKYDRAGTKVYLGEYAAHEPKRERRWRAALAEAAYLTALERHGDVVHLASYAPLLARRGHTQWDPNMIYFDGDTVSPTYTYTVQKLFSENAGDEKLAQALTGDTSAADDKRKTLAASVVRRKSDGEVIVKVVSREDGTRRLKIALPFDPDQSGSLTTMHTDLMAEAMFGEKLVEPTTKALNVSREMTLDLPPTSLTILRVRPAR